MEQILFYIIPFNGIFLSVFFLFRTERPPGNNFLMGSMLLALSCFSLLQYVQSFTGNPSQFPAPRYILNELLISPFLFLYTVNLLRPAGKLKIWLHLLFIAINLPLLIRVNWSYPTLQGIIISAFSVMNGIYLFSSLLRIKNSLRWQEGERKQGLYAGYYWVYILNMLVAGTVFYSIACHVICPAGMFGSPQLAKGLVIFYTYLKILSKAPQGAYTIYQ